MRRHVLVVLFAAVTLLALAAPASADAKVPPVTLADGEAAIANVIAHPRNATRVLDWSVYDADGPAGPLR